MRRRSLGKDAAKAKQRRRKSAAYKKKQAVQAAHDAGETVGPGAPKFELTEQDYKSIESLAPVLSQKEICDRLGFSERTLRNRMTEDPRAREAYDRGRAAAVQGVATGVLQRALEGSQSDAFFYLKTQAGWKETTVIQVDDLEHASDETLADLAAGRVPKRSR